nr:hypothetical protein [Hyphomonas sp.]
MKAQSLLQQVVSAFLEVKGLPTPAPGGQHVFFQIINKKQGLWRDIKLCLDVGEVGRIRFCNANPARGEDTLHPI